MRFFLLFAAFMCAVSVFGLPSYAAEKKALRYDFSAFQKDKQTSSEEDQTAKRTVFDLIFLTPDFSTFAVAVQKSGLLPPFNDKDPVTIFIPHNDAFASLPAGELERLFKDTNRAELAMILKSHMLPGSYHADAIELGETKVTTLSGQETTLSRAADGILLSNASVTKSDIKASNGFIHMTDRVIIPPVE